jgi:phosphate starvation-inducible PhoH-like protein
MSKSTIKKVSSKFLKSHEIDDMENVIVPLKKHKKTSTAGLFNLHIKDIHPLTENQGRVFRCYDDDKNIVCSGSAGTGKSFVLLYLCLHDLIHSREYNKVMIFRSSVPTRNIGFLPGDEKEKLAVYEAPYKAICGDLFSRSDAYDILKKKDLIEFQSTSYVRGNTFDNCLIIVDECQDMNLHELSTVITRCGQGTRIFFSGDFKQCDFDGKREVSGFNDFIRIVNQIESFEVVDFGLDDIVRSGLVKEYLVAKEKLNL